MAQAVTVQYFIQSDEELELKLASKGLKVVEVYSEWCGPCKSILPTFKRIRMDRDDEKNLLFLVVCAEKCSFLEAAVEHRGNSEPLFLLYRNGRMKQRIEGANTPELDKHIYSLIPMNADADELDDNPIYQTHKKNQEAAAKAAKAKK